MTAVVSSLVAVGAVGYTMVQTRFQYRREDFELARALHADLTTGAVADARNTLAIVSESKRGYVRKIDINRITDAYFTLLWCFERVYSGRQSMANRRARGRGTPDAVAFLDELVAWHVARWWEALADAQREIRVRTRNAIDDRLVRAGYEQLFLVLFGDDTEAKFKRFSLPTPDPDEIRELRERYSG
jgi:hypothetical protein